MLATKTVIFVTCAALGAACTSDPQYVDDGVVLEANDPSAPDDVDTSRVSSLIDLPFRLEKPEELEERQALAAELGVEVPYVKVDDVKISIEWSISNLSDEPGLAFIFMNGANELASYVPTNFVVDPEEDDEPPPLMGGIPLPIEGGQTLSGVFREQEIVEGSVDLELMYRAQYNVFAAVLEQNNTTSEIIDAAGVTVPSSVFASMVRFEVILTANRNMVMRYAIRVRDERGILHQQLLNPDDPSELTVFNPVQIQPPPPDMP